MAKDKKPRSDGADEANARATTSDAGIEAAPAPSRPKPLGTAKAVETMFRNAVRSEMDIIALAAMKANIMISLNGLIISALIISGAFIFASSAAFLLPAGVFMATAAASIVFALLAASPERADTLAAARDWMIAVARRRAGLRDLPAYLRREDAAGQDGSLNLLIYQDRVQLTREDYWDRMQTLLRDRDDIYHKMSDQLYWLGLMADRKFRLLNASYSIFRWGLLASVLVFVGLKGTLGLFPGLQGDATPRLRNLGISEFSNIYEPSAVQQLPDGRILVVEDEADRAFSLMSFAPEGTLIEDSVADARLARAFGRTLTDLEGLSLDDQGRIYAVTSHSGNKDGERKPDREQLLRFRIAGNAVGEVATHTTLRDELARATALHEAIFAQGGQVPDFDTLNIEGLAYHRQNRHLLLGLRAPLAGQRSLIVTITNPDAMFAQGAAPEFGPPVLLDLRGGGIRALSHDPVLGAYLIVNEIEGHDGNRYSQLWSWSGQPDAEAQPIALPDIINLNNVESIDSVVIGGEARLLIMSDEGNEAKGRPAKYMLLDYGQLGR